jgi:murein DD-endopeptidase MepM/ murein hydrolase activator NlpD
MKSAFSIMKSAFSMLAAALVCSSASAACELGEHLQHPSPGEIYAWFGYRKHPLLQTTTLHAGWDYKGSEGDPIAAAEAGKVVEAGWQSGYGKYIRIDHGKGLETAYAHLRQINVKPGSCVSKGQVIATAGRTGLATEPHLHFEIIRDRRFIDPASLLPERG